MRTLRPSVPPAIEEVVARAMSKKRDDRYATATEMQRALGRARPGADRRASARTPLSVPKAVVPDVMAQSSVEIPITFSESEIDDSDLIAASSPVPLPDFSGDGEESPYDDETSATTLKMDGRGLIAEASKQKPSANFGSYSVRIPVSATREALARMAIGMVAVSRAHFIQGFSSKKKP